jgi:hypothetical protein
MILKRIYSICFVFFLSLANLKASIWNEHPNYRQSIENSIVLQYESIVTIIKESSYTEEKKKQLLACWNDIFITFFSGKKHSESVYKLFLKRFFYQLSHYHLLIQLLKMHDIHFQIFDIWLIQATSLYLKSFLKIYSDLSSLSLMNNFLKIDENQRPLPEAFLFFSPLFRKITLIPEDDRAIYIGKIIIMLNAFGTIWKTFITKNSDSIVYQKEIYELIYVKLAYLNDLHKSFSNIDIHNLHLVPILEVMQMLFELTTDDDEQLNPTIELLSKMTKLTFIEKYFHSPHPRQMNPKDFESASVRSILLNLKGLIRDLAHENKINFPIFYENAFGLYRSKPIRDLLEIEKKEFHKKAFINLGIVQPKQYQEALFYWIVPTQKIAESTNSDDAQESLLHSLEHTFRQLHHSEDPFFSRESAYWLENLLYNMTMKNQKKTTNALEDISTNHNVKFFDVWIPHENRNIQFFRDSLESLHLWARSEILQEISHTLLIAKITKHIKILERMEKKCMEMIFKIFQSYYQKKLKRKMKKDIKMSMIQKLQSPVFSEYSTVYDFLKRFSDYVANLTQEHYFFNNFTDVSNEIDESLSVLQRETLKELYQLWVQRSIYTIPTTPSLEIKIHEAPNSSSFCPF